jgi:hypothetical protein
MKWLRCKVVPGAFSDESIVEVVTSEGHELSFFVPRSRVAEGRVRVLVNYKGGKTWVILPTAEPFHAISVRASDIMEEATA